MRGFIDDPCRYRPVYDLTDSEIDMDVDNDERRQ